MNQAYIIDDGKVMAERTELNVDKSRTLRRLHRIR